LLQTNVKNLILTESCNVFVMIGLLVDSVSPLGQISRGQHSAS